MWLLKGGPTGFTNIGRGAASASSSVLTDFENLTVGDMLLPTHLSMVSIGCMQSTIAIDPVGRYE